jgi:hypothetical protein
MKKRKLKTLEYYKYHSQTAEVRNYVFSQITKHYALDDKLEILEIGNFVLDSTLKLYETFCNANITSCDCLHDVMQHIDVFTYFVENYKKMNDRVNLVIANFQESHVLLKDYYDLTIIDVGQHSANIIEILEKIPRSKNIFILLPTSTESRRKERNIVLDYLNNKKYNIEILNNPWVRIYE